MAQGADVANFIHDLLMGQLVLEGRHTFLAFADKAGNRSVGLLLDRAGTKVWSVETFPGRTTRSVCSVANRAVRVVIDRGGGVQG